MPCHAAIDNNFISVLPETLTEDTLKIMKKKHIRFACITNEKNTFLGLFSYETLIKNLLPISVSTGDTYKTDITVKAAPGIAKRLNKVAIMPISNVMNRKCTFVNPETPLWEGISMLIDYGSPLVIIEEQSKKLIGLLTNKSAALELERLGKT